MTDLNTPDRTPHELPILDEVGSELRRLFRQEELAHGSGRSRRRSSRRRSGLRVATAIAIAVLITAAVAAAAGGLLFGSPVAPEERLTPTVGWGVPIRSSVRLIGLSAADPLGGLPWGIRIIQTTRGLGCIQFGRLSAGRLWVIGQDGAFHDDGRLHELPTDIFEPESCTSLDALGHTFVAVGRVAVPASAYDLGCRGPEGAGTPARHDACPANDERALFYGALGPRARSIVYTLDGRTVRTPTVSPDGAYLIVTRADPRADPNVGGPDSPNGSSILPQGGLQQPIRSIEYRGGYVCNIGASGDRDERGQPCSEPGYLPAPIGATASEVRAPIRARLFLDREGRRGAPEVAVQISFTARVAIRRSGQYYDADLVNPCTGASSDAEPPNDIAAGQRVTIRLQLSSSGDAAKPCPRIYRGSVRFVAQPFYFDSEPPSSRDRRSSLTVGRFSIRAP
jgi:hypothetical protein